MIPLLQLIKFDSKYSKSHSSLIDFQQRYARNIFIFSFGLCIARQLFEKNIICHTQRHLISTEYVNTQCFINGTFTNEDPIIYHNYYQWVPIYILLSAFSFYFPFSWWSRLNKSYLNEISVPTKSEEDAEKLYKKIEESKGNLLFIKTWILELFYLLHLFIYIVVTDVFFNNLWYKMKWSWKTIAKLFPETGTCYVDYYSGSGITTGKFICILPLNVVYQKIFWALYVLLIFLIILHSFMLLYRIKIYIEYGPIYSNVWWSVNIAKKSAETWKALQFYKKISIKKQCRFKNILKSSKIFSKKKSHDKCEVIKI